MKICFANPTLILKRPIAELSANLSHKHKVSILMPKLLGKKRHSKTHNSPKANFLTYNTITLPIMWDWPIPGLGFFQKSWSALKNNDVVHMWVPYYMSSFFISLLKLFFFPKKKLFLAMDTLPGYSFNTGFMNYLFGFFNYTVGQIIFYSCDKIILYGNSFKPFAKRAGIPMHKVEVLPTGISINNYSSRKDVRKELNISKKTTVVFFVGLISNRKGVDTVLEVAKKFKNEDFVFVLAGEGPKLNSYKKKAEGLPIKFLGQRTDIPDLFKASDIFFLPTRGEGLAGVIMEAMKFSVPVVTSKIPGNTDLITKETGLLCNEDDVRGFVEAIRKLSRSPSLARSLAIKAKASLKRNFDWKNNAKGYEVLYKCAE